MSMKHIAVGIAKSKVEVQMKSLPDRHIAEEVDFELWGKGFCAAVASYVQVAKALGAPDDDDMPLWLSEAQDVFAGFDRRDWLAWGGQILLVSLQEKVDAEAVASAERANVAKASQDIVGEPEPGTARDEIEALSRSFAEGQIDAATFAEEIANIEAKGPSKAKERLFLPDSDGEPEIVPLARPTIIIPARTPKRKLDEASKLREVEGKCDHCRGYKADTPCIYSANSAKCDKCVDEKSGCYWGGISRSGVERKTGAKKATRSGGQGSSAVAEQSSARAPFIPTGLLDPSIGPSKFVGKPPPGLRTQVRPAKPDQLSSRAKGKRRATEPSEEGSSEEVSEELAVIRKDRRQLEARIRSARAMIRALDARELELSK